MDSFNSTLFDLFNENQAQDENCCNTETQTIIIQEYEKLKTSSQQEKARLETQIKLAEIENKGKELKILKLEELVTSLWQRTHFLKESSEQENMKLQAQIREKDMKIRNCQSDLEQSLWTHLEVKNILEIQNQEAENENEMKAMKITELEAEVSRISDELEDKDRALEDAAVRIVRLRKDLDASQRRENELSATVYRLGPENERAQRENHDLRKTIRVASCGNRAMDLALEAATKMIEGLQASLKTISDSLQEKTQLQKDAEMESDRQKSKIKELEELLTNGQSREREYLKQNSDLETNSQNEKTRLMAQIQEMENAMINARVPLESSVDDIIDVKVEEKEIIPSKSRDNDKNTGEKWKKGLLIGGGCLAAAVALWKYGPDVSGLASALNQPRLTGNLL